MPLFSKRKSGKQKSKVGRNDTKLETNKTNTSQKVKHQDTGSRHGFNDISTTSDVCRKDLLKSCQRPANSSAKCVANFPRQSRLSKSLPEVLVDDAILPSFLEFLQKQDAQNVLNFWLAAETFRLSSREKFNPNSMMQSSHKASQNHLKANIGSNFESGHSALRTGVLVPGNIPDSSRTQSKTFSGKSSETLNIIPSLECFDKDNPSNDTSHQDGYEVSSTCDTTSLNLTSQNLNKSSGHLEIGSISPGLYTNNDNGHTKCNVNSNSQSQKRLDRDSSKCNLESANKNELYDEDDENRIFQSQGKDETSIHQARERRRMSKVMLDDALSIYRHFISLDATQPLGVDENMRRQVESNICTENGIIASNCFNAAQKFAYDTLQSRYFDDFIRSSHYQKHIMDILTSGKVFLADIMYNDDAMFYFMEFMEQEGKSYLLAFWFAVDSFCQELQSKLDKEEYNPDQALSDAMVLYDKYFSMQATNSLGVSDETRIRIENKICREGGPLPECFEEPMENVLTLLEEVYFSIFLDSSVYMKYLNEVFSSVTDIDLDQTSTCADDCSSTASAGEAAKLMESLVNDAEAHEDPDEIWQRPHFGLSIGRVNEFGIYEPGIEPQPGKKEDLKFRQKMKKLVSGDSDKMKEEMAWKVAKMVLEDVKKQQKKAR
ncbi:A-kinase anchor protein 10, mitochondrial-like [Dendronephthya gigantea]|uniref:A-kinase anchor protein 10, mitochondrial-like n=1 Tax=Dendronephthya gigantea TaxID=151771 RepID=UPI00106A4409|nr:A-kinase anchor protein 10, mitochondrial-like [Dendronephthya gigantea]